MDRILTLLGDRNDSYYENEIKENVMFTERKSELSRLRTRYRTRINAKAMYILPRK